jgi:hypothetical protein
MRTGPHQTGSRHVSTPDPRLGPIQGSGMFYPGTLGPPCGRPGPYTGGVRIPFQGSGWHKWRSGTNPGGLACISGGPGPTLGGPDCISRGSALSCGGPDSLLMLWSIPPSLDTWRLQTRPCGWVGRCCGPRIAA